MMALGRAAQPPHRLARPHLKTFSPEEFRFLVWGLYCSGLCSACVRLPQAQPDGRGWMLVAQFWGSCLRGQVEQPSGVRKEALNPVECSYAKAHDT